jgi:hypothetical protein
MMQAEAGGESHLSLMFETMKSKLGLAGKKLKGLKARV